MSRSRKRHPFTSITCGGDRAGAEKAYKVSEHRRLRRAVRESVRNGELDVLPHDRSYGDPWLGPKDGKWRIMDLERWGRYLRK
jgi:hypothetical protein